MERTWRFIMPALVGIALVLGWHVRTLHGVVEESESGARSARSRLENTERELTLWTREAKRLGALRDSLEANTQRLEERISRQALIDEIPEKLAKVRGLAAKTQLRVRWIDRAFTKEFLKKEIKRELPKGFADAYSRALARLGLLPPGFELERAMTSLFTEQAAGFYDPRTKTLYVADGIPVADLVLSHEIAHAIVDQHFDLQKLLGTAILDNDDRTFAVRALVEGDATFAMQRYFAGELSLWKIFEVVGEISKLTGMEQSELDAAPVYVREPLVRSYLGGMAFIAALHRAGGLARVDRAFAEPPVSSEQILHPEKYLAGEKPVPVVLPDLLPILGPGFTILHENTLGELGALSLFLGTEKTRDMASLAAAGWGGDRLRAYAHPDGRLALVWRTTWDTPKDATEFLAAHAIVLETRYGKPAGPGLRWKTAHGFVLAAASGNDAVLIDGAADDAQATLLAKTLGVTP